MTIDTNREAEVTHSDLRRYFVPGLLLAVAVIGYAYSVIRAVLADDGTYNLHVQQAFSFIHGRLYIDDPVPDFAVFDGHYFSVFPPLPAILMIPFVIVFGVAGAKGTVLGILLTGIGAVALYRIFEILKVGKATAVWLSAGFFLGTGYWFVVLGSSTVWMLSQTVAVTFSLLCLNFLLKAGHTPISMALSGLFLGFAFLSRQMAVYMIVYCLAYLWFAVAEGERGKFVRLAVAFIAPFSACAVSYLVFNGLRFGNPLESGYQYLALGDSLGGVRFQKYGLFNAAYVPFNISSMFFNGFQLDFGGKTLTEVVGVSPWGTSILFASPFLLTAFYARGNKRVLAAMWTSVTLSLIHILLYFNNGYVQTNTNRFSLDFIPLLMVMCALGVRTAPGILWKAGIAWAIALNFLALVVL